MYNENGKFPDLYLHIFETEFHISKFGFLISKKTEKHQKRTDLDEYMSMDTEKPSWGGGQWTMENINDFAKRNPYAQLQSALSPTGISYVDGF